MVRADETVGDALTDLLKFSCSCVRETRGEGRVLYIKTWLPVLLCLKKNRWKKLASFIACWFWLAKLNNCYLLLPYLDYKLNQSKLDSCLENPQHFFFLLHPVHTTRILIRVGLWVNWIKVHPFPCAVFKTLKQHSRTAICPIRRYGSISNLCFCPDICRTGRWDRRKRINFFLHGPSPDWSLTCYLSKRGELWELFVQNFQCLTCFSNRGSIFFYKGRGKCRKESGLHQWTLQGRLLSIL